MRRAHRWWLAAFGALLALPLLAVALLLWWVEPDSLRPAIEAQVRERFGVDLQLTGSLHWKLWPALAVQSGPGALGAGREHALLRWQGLQFTLQWPGLHDTAWQLDGLVVDGLQLRLQSDAAGRWNLADLIDAIDAAPSGTTSAPRSLRIHPLRLRNADIAVRAAPDSSWWRLTQLDVDADLDGSSDRQQWTLANLRASGQLGGGVLPDAPQAASLETARVAIELPVAAAAALTQGAGRSALVRIAPLQTRLGAASLRVSAAQPLQWQPLRGAGEVQFETSVLRDWLTAQGVVLPPTRDAGVLRAASLGAQWQLSEAEAGLSMMQLRLDDTQLQGHVAGRWRDPQAWQLELQGDGLNLDRYRRPDSDPGEPFRLPEEALRALPLNGSVRLQRLIAGGAIARDALIELHSATPAQTARRP